MTIDPRNAAVLAQVGLIKFLHSLAVRPTDGVMFGGDGDGAGIFKVNPAIGAATLVGLTGQNFVGDLAFRPVAGPPAALDLNQHGLTGSWYEPATNGQGVEVEVFPDLIAPGTGRVQVSWFTYDANAPGGRERQRWYTLGGNITTGAASVALPIYQNVGGNFNAAPITNSTQVGTATLRFADCEQGTLDYTFTDGSGRSGTLDLTRLTKNVTCVASGARPVNADFALSGNWYDPATSGQGITAEINPLSPVAFFAWYTYAPGGSAAGAAGQRWYTGQSGYVAGARTLTMILYETTGGLFDAPMPTPATVAVGTATLTFQSCTVATLDYTFTGGSSAGASGRITLTKIGPAGPGCVM
jgi:hypothetical protein